MVGKASSWDPSTRENYEVGYGRFLNFAESIGELDPKEKPFERATDDRLRRFHARLIEDGLAPYTIANYIMGVACVLAAMHPDRDFSRFTRASRRLHREASPIRDVSKQFVPIEEIYGLAWRLMFEAEAGPFRSDVERAILFRDGSILALLCDCPIRRPNLAVIELDRHLDRRKDEWWLRFDASEMKADRPFACPWGEESAPALHRYLGKHREVLLRHVERGFMGEPTNALWISKRWGRKLSYNDVATRVQKRTLDAFGVAINPHTFRHLGNTIIATLHPRSAPLMAGLLAHASIDASETSYNLARQVDALDRWQEVLHEIRKRDVVR
jgi:integrase